MALTLLFVFGTRPEAIKMAPVIRRLRGEARYRARVCVTAQHRQMLDPVLRLFEIAPDRDLNLMAADQDLYDLTGRVLVGLRGVLRAERPDLVLVQGDTTTTFAAALAAFYARVPVAHIEAGLRTGNPRAPFPEELNRVLTTRLADLFFAPTEANRRNLLAEGVPDAAIRVTGNPGIDALLWVRARLPERPPAAWRPAFGPAWERLAQPAAPVILVTGHRREHFGAPFRAICGGLRELAARHPDWALVYPVHLNPQVQRPVRELLSGLDNVHLLAPLEYEPFVWLMNRAALILTDSGGVQEEAPSLGKPVLVMRESTERPEAVAAGTVRLVGADPARIVRDTEAILADPAVCRRMARAHNPYGDGQAAGRIADALDAWIARRTPPAGPAAAEPSS